LIVLPTGLVGFLQPTAYAATTFIVNSTGDASDSNMGDGVCNDGVGNCTLRAALQEANSSTGTDTINFAIGSGVQTITLQSDLPTITDPVVIDGTTQPGFSGRPIIELNGNNLSNALRPGLFIRGGNSVVRGLVLNRFHFEAIFIDTNGGNRIEGNYIGTDVTGNTALPNAGGIILNSSNNVIGGLGATKRNLISGNSGYGVEVQVAGVIGNVFQNNYIGVSFDGTSALPNGSDGISLSVRDSTIGGTAPGAGNVISGNGRNGMWLSSNNLVQGNFVGTNAQGTAAIPNRLVGIETSGSNNMIGGTTPEARNVISGNTEAGVNLDQTSASGNVVQGNYIGVGADGVTPIPNSRMSGNTVGGVSIKSGKNNVIGGTAAGAGNIIAFNGEALSGTPGVAILSLDSDSATGNVVRGNSIFANSGVGITIGAPVNDAGDGDTGANNKQNYPVLTSATSAGGGTNVKGLLNSTSNTQFNLDFYANSVCDASGRGEGAKYIGSSTVTTNASGDVNFDVTLPMALSAGQVVTATAVDPSGNSSEFSACAGGPATGAVQFASASTSYNANEGAGSALITLTRVGGSVGSIEVEYSTSDGTAQAGVDYTPASGVITFADGETSKSFTVPLLDDALDEQLESVFLDLRPRSAPDTVGTTHTAMLFIQDNDPPPSLSVSDVAVVEGNSGTSNAVFTVRLSVPSGKTVDARCAPTDQGGTATAIADFSLMGTTLIFNPGETEKTFSVAVVGDTSVEPDETFFLDIQNANNATISQSRGTGTIINDDGPTLIQFDSAAYSAGEGTHVATVTVNRRGDLSGSSAVDYRTVDGAASERTDYTTTIGTLRFAPGETSKTFDVLLTEDGFAEGDEQLNLTLSNPQGGAALGGQPSATLTILDNEGGMPSPTNPIDSSSNFVRQHYHDFLNREPDASGLQFWTNEIEQCGADAKCREVKRINVSAAFFLSIEFQETGYLVYRTYKAAYGDATSPNVPGTVPVVRFREFLGDTQQIARGVQVGIGNWQQLLEANKQAYALDFVQRQQFLSAFPASMTADEFVSRLDENAGRVLSADERAQFVSTLAAAPSDSQQRAVVLRQVAESAPLRQREFNRAFVLMQYFGYLRRAPDAVPDADFRGWKFWLDKLNQFNGNFVSAEMVKAFISSDEYRKRFGQ
jgi:CSLREA domain-containing protein